MINRGFEPKTFGFVDKYSKRSAIEDIPRCLYDIQFLFLFYCYNVLRIQFPYYEQFLNKIPLLSTISIFYSRLAY